MDWSKCINLDTECDKYEPCNIHTQYTCVSHYVMTLDGNPSVSYCLNHLTNNYTNSKVNFVKMIEQKLHSEKICWECKHTELTYI